MNPCPIVYKPFNMEAFVVGLVFNKIQDMKRFHINIFFEEQFSEKSNYNINVNFKNDSLQDLHISTEDVRCFHNKLNLSFLASQRPSSLDEIHCLPPLRGIFSNFHELRK